MSTLLLSRHDVAELLDMDEEIKVMERVFRDYAAHRVEMPAKVYVHLEKGDFRAMPSAIPGACGVKWVNVHPQNRALGLPTVMAVFIFNDPSSGYPLAIMDATEITAYRTAAVSANASRYLARAEASTLGLIGAGHQAYMHLESHSRVFSLALVKVYDKRPEAVSAFINHFPRLKVVAASAEEATASDIVCTLTPATATVVRASWVKPGTHINAVGADAAGKQELDPAILGTARVVVDDWAQASHSGEINVPLSQGWFHQEQIHATLGEIIAGAKPGREDASMVTVFDSTGLAIEDLATAQMVYRKARQRGGYPSVELV